MLSRVDHPALPLGTAVLLPGLPRLLRVARHASVAALEAARSGDGHLVLVTSAAGQWDMLEVGVLAAVRSRFPDPDVSGAHQVLLEPLARVVVEEVDALGGLPWVKGEVRADPEGGPSTAALRERVADLLYRGALDGRRANLEMALAAEHAGPFLDRVAESLAAPEDLHGVLLTWDLHERLARVEALLER